MVAKLARFLLQDVKRVILPTGYGLGDSGQRVSRHFWREEAQLRLLVGLSVGVEQMVGGLVWRLGVRIQHVRLVHDSKRMILPAVLHFFRFDKITQPLLECDCARLKFRLHQGECHV